jgi:hypothetical protein
MKSNPNEKPREDAMLTKNQELELRRQAKQTADKYIPDPNAWGRRYSKRQILPVSYESLGLTCDRFDPDGVDLKQ